MNNIAKVAIAIALMGASAFTAGFTAAYVLYASQAVNAETPNTQTQETVRPALYHVGDKGVHFRLTQEVFIDKATWDSKDFCWKYDVHYNTTNGVAAWSDEKKNLPEYELERPAEKTP